MMALESSVLGCGSDDWSVDSEYNFQDFEDDAQRVEHVGSLSTPEPIHQDMSSRITSCSSRSGINTASEGTRSTRIPEEEMAKWNICALSHDKVDEAPTGATPAAIPDEIDATLTRRESAGECGKNTACFVGSEREHLPFAAGVRSLGDSGSSTDSSHVLRLEQRMFLKVRTYGFDFRLPFVGFANGSQRVFTRENLPFHEQQSSNRSFIACNIPHSRPLSPPRDNIIRNF